MRARLHEEDWLGQDRQEEPRREGKEERAEEKPTLALSACLVLSFSASLARITDSYKSCPVLLLLLVAGLIFPQQRGGRGLSSRLHCRATWETYPPREKKANRFASRYERETESDLGLYVRADAFHAHAGGKAALEEAEKKKKKWG